MGFKRRLLVALLVILLGAGVAAAREIQQGDQCVIEAARTVDGNLFVLCRTLLLDGRVNGNVIGAATTAVINGTVTGDLYMVAGQMDVRGKIGEDLHFAGPVLRLHDEAALMGDRADLLSFTLSTELAQGSDIPGTVTALGYQFVSQGRIGGELSFWGSSLNIEGEVGGDIDAQVGDPNADVSQLETLLIPVPIDITLRQPGLLVAENAEITGQLTYASPAEAAIPPDTVQGETVYNPVVVQPDFTQITIGNSDPSSGVSLYLSQAVREFLTLGFVGLIGLLIAPRALQAPLRNLQARPLVCFGVGMLSFIVSFVAVPFAILLTVLLVIIVALFQVNELTIAVATLLGVVDVGGASALFIVVIFISRVIFCLAIGRAVVRVLFRGVETGTLRQSLLGLLIGAVLLALVAALPVAGWVFNGLAAFLGLGAILTIVQARAERAREGSAAPRYSITTPSVTPPPPPALRRADEPRLIPPPPPIIESHPRPLGTDNLPDGFTWWDD